MSKVSIIVPVHNTASFLPKCLDSILNQTLSDIEVILVENGSTDNSLTLCYALAEKDSRIKVLHLSEGDLSTARNKGVKVATSPYVGFVDSDDTILPTMYEDMYKLAIENNLGLVNSNFVYKYDHKPDRFSFKEDGAIRILTAKEMTKLNFQEKISKTVCTMLYKKDLFDSIQFPQKMYFEDRASTFLFMSQCGRGAVINKSYYCYYQRDGSISHDNSYRKCRDYILSDCMRLDFLKQSGVFTEDEQIALAYKSSNTLARKLRKLYGLASSAQQKEEFFLLLKKLTLIPKHTRMSPSGYVSFVYLRALQLVKGR